MKIVVQRVKEAKVLVANKIIGSCSKGLVLLVGYGANSKKEANQKLAKKIVNLRIFSDESGKFDKSLIDIKGELLIVPQFTLYADTNKGRRPDFFSAMPPKEATLLFDDFIEEISKLGIKYETGRFGADMEVSLVNDGPVTILFEE